MTVHPKIQPASEQERKPTPVVLDDFELWYFGLEPRKSTLPSENDVSDFDGSSWVLP
jgi:hypothetical protein